MCVQKDAIIILWPDGSYAEDIGVDCKTTYMGGVAMAVPGAGPPVAHP